MPNLSSLLKDEIVRLARKELKAQIDPLKKISVGYRREIASLKRSVADLERGRKSLEKRVSRSAPAPADLSEDAVEDRKVRFSAKGLTALRTKLGLSVAGLAGLLSVTPQSIYNWEQGKTVPRREQVLALAALRGIGKREAQARLAALSQ